MNERSISVIVPVYKSGEILPSLCDRVVAALKGLTDNWEIILIDDGSNDGTYDRMVSLHETEPRIKLVRFAKNMGQHTATLCGLRRATGEIILTLDDDLQNPPEEIARFIAKLDEGFDLVIGRIVTRKRHNYFRNVSSRIVQKLVSRILSKPEHLALSSYRCMTKRAAVGISGFTGVHAYMPALMFSAVPWDRITNLDVGHEDRVGGRSTYTVGKLIKLASYLVINHSYMPLRLMTAWGVALSMISVAYAAWVVAHVVFFGATISGWPSLAVLVAFLCGNILLFMGILGEYIGRLVEENSRAQQFPIFESRG